MFILSLPLLPHLSMSGHTWSTVTDCAHSWNLHPPTPTPTPTHTHTHHTHLLKGGGGGVGPSKNWATWGGYEIFC